MLIKKFKIRIAFQREIENWAEQCLRDALIFNLEPQNITTPQMD